MPTYQYQAKDRDGRPATGHVEAPSESEAAAQVRGMGLFVTSLRVAGGAERSSSRSSREGVWAQVFPPVNLGKRLMFWRQFSSLLQSGVSVSEAFRSIADTSRGHMARVAMDAARRTASGEPASAVLSDYPGTFPRAEVALLMAGERAGNTAETVRSLAEMNEREAQFRREYMFQLAYPVLVFVCILFIPLLPVAVLQGGGAALGIIRTRYVPPAIILFAVFVFARLLFALAPPAAVAWDFLKLRAPGVGAIVMRLAASRACSLIGAAYRSGLDLPLAVELAAGSCGNAAMGKRLMQAVPSIRGGESLTNSLGRTHAFPLRALQMLATGEKTGNVDEMMESASGYFRDEAHTFIRLSAVGLGVLALVIAGMIVLGMAMSFYGGYGQSLPVD